ncbi:MAG: mobile mystery protein A [Candidatus Kapaibacterium sp.]
MDRKSLQLQQLDSKTLKFASLAEVAMPPTGWIKAIRTALGMSMQQLASRLNITKQGVMDIERREKDGSITIKSLRNIAQAMDMRLVYGFVPNDGSLEALIEKRANELATRIVMRTAATMKLEDQSVSTQRLEEAIKQRTLSLCHDMPKMLWD